MHNIGTREFIIALAFGALHSLRAVLLLAYVLCLLYVWQAYIFMGI